MRRIGFCTIIALIPLATLAGCPANTSAPTPAGSPGTSLQGTWKASDPEGGSAGNFLLTINAAGELTALHIDSPALDLPVASGTIVYVNGSAVAFSDTFPGGLGSLAFDGTLNDTATTMTGTLRVRANSPPMDLSTAAVFVRQ